MVPVPGIGVRCSVSVSIADSLFNVAVGKGEVTAERSGLTGAPLSPVGPPHLPAGRNVPLMYTSSIVTSLAEK